MKIWLTARYDDNGIEEIETTDDPVGDVFSWKAQGTTCISCGWYVEGVTWHRTKKAAVEQAVRFRSERIREATENAARIAALPPIAA